MNRALWKSVIVLGWEQWTAKMVGLFGQSSYLHDKDISLVTNGMDRAHTGASALRVTFECWSTAFSSTSAFAPTIATLPLAW